MYKHWAHSLFFRLGIVMTVIVVFAILGAASALLTADAVQGKAVSVDIAGSLRMQSYRIATNLVYDNNIDIQSYRDETSTLVADFEQDLYSDELVDILPDDPSHPLRAAHQKVRNRWQHEIEPLLDIYLAGITSTNAAISLEARTNLRARYLEMMPWFVADIDEFVNLLAQDAETNFDRLRVYQLVVLFVTLLLVILALCLIHKQVRTPLNILLGLAENAGGGDFSTRTPYHGKDELGRLGHAFNLMTADLDRLYRDLEARVEEKTTDLTRSKQSLELLYRTVRSLNESAHQPTTYTTLLQDIAALADTGPGKICLADQPQCGASTLASTFVQDYEQQHTCKSTNCGACLSDSDTQMLNLEGIDGVVRRMISIPICDQSKRYGVLLMELREGRKLEDWQRRLLEAVTNHIGISLTLSRQATEHRRLALLEERGVIARELHDSLAQALSYLKIQVTRLENSLLPDTDHDSSTRTIIREIREGLGSAYQELRELLTTFRLRMDEQDLAAALEATVTEFAKRSTTTITLDYRLRHNTLSANEEIHLLHIVREALSNVVNHANASACRVSLEQQDNGNLILSIDDNGKGFPQAPAKPQHYGLTIIEERARGLTGNLAFKKSPLGGACVSLSFTPTHRRGEERLLKAAG